MTKEVGFNKVIHHRRPGILVEHKKEKELIEALQHAGAKQDEERGRGGEEGGKRERGYTAGGESD